MHLSPKHTYVHKHSQTDTQTLKFIVIYADTHVHSEHIQHLTTLRHLKWPSTPTRALCINSTPCPLSSSSAGFLSVAVPLPEGGSQQCPTPSCVTVLIMPHFFITCPSHSYFPCNFLKSWFIRLYLVRYSAKYIKCCCVTKKLKKLLYCLL